MIPPFKTWVPIALNCPAWPWLLTGASVERGHFLPYHVLKASKDSGSDDAQEQADNVEDGGRPKQVVEVDDVLAAADVDVFIVPTGNLHPAGQGEPHSSQSPRTGWPLGLWLSCSSAKNRWASRGLYSKDTVINQSVIAVYRKQKQKLLPAREILVIITNSNLR